MDPQRPEGTRLMLLDTASLYYRAFYGVPATVAAPDGTPVNAVRGLLDAIARLIDAYHPTHLAACWDEDWRPGWRVALVPGYKAQRVAQALPDGTWTEEAPEALTAQVPVIREVLTALRLPIVGARGFEADDVIGTLAAHATGPVDVVTGDRDLLQLVDDTRHVRVISTMRGMARLEEVTDETVRARYGVDAAQYADFATLRGDPSDGLPGVPGIGDKSAAALLAAHGTLDAIREAARSGAGTIPPRQAARLNEAAEYLDAATAVVRIARDVPLTERDLRLPQPDEALRTRVQPLAQRWGLDAPMRRLLAALGAG